MTLTSACEELQAEWGRDTQRAVAFLQKRGWRLNLAWQWVPPSPGHQADDKESRAVLHLKVLYMDHEHEVTSDA